MFYPVSEIIGQKIDRIQRLVEENSTQAMMQRLTEHASYVVTFYVRIIYAIVLFIRIHHVQLIDVGNWTTSVLFMHVIARDLRITELGSEKSNLKCSVILLLCSCRTNGLDQVENSGME